jgi:hypothetical protein
MPGETLAVFGDALRRLSTAATYLYHDGTRSNALSASRGLLTARRRTYRAWARAVGAVTSDERTSCARLSTMPIEQRRENGRFCEGRFSIPNLLGF